MWNKQRSLLLEHLKDFFSINEYLTAVWFCIMVATVSSVTFFQNTYLTNIMLTSYKIIRVAIAIAFDDIKSNFFVCLNKFKAYLKLNDKIRFSTFFLLTKLTWIVLKSLICISFANKAVFQLRFHAWNCWNHLFCLMIKSILSLVFYLKPHQIIVNMIKVCFKYWVSYFKTNCHWLIILWGEKMW